jgi:hypothetical protein
VSEYLDALEELIGSAEEAAGLEDAIDKARAENRVVGEACETVADLSASGDISESELSSLASNLSDILDNYNKTDIKGELREHFSEGRKGTPLDEVIESRLDELQVIHSTDAKQSTVWRWHFSDGVQIETETSKDGGREHHAWPVMKNYYFDQLVSLGRGERIAPPTSERRDAEDWREFVDNLILERSTPVEHVGPRTEAVRLLRDYVSRSIGYCEMPDVRERQGVWVDADAEQGIATDGGPTELRIPFEQIQRTCEQVGITTRALQIELQARGLTNDELAGVSAATYVDGVRVPYWSLTTALGEPDQIVAEAQSPAEKAAERQDMGATPDPDGQQADEENDEENDDEPEPGLRGSFGTDPDEADTDE